MKQAIEILEKSLSDEIEDLQKNESMLKTEFTGTYMHDFFNNCIIKNKEIIKSLEKSIAVLKKNDEKGHYEGGEIFITKKGKIINSDDEDCDDDNIYFVCING